uniref:PH-interacting protein-like isoform X2 n=1 Tax=Erigeron canadensis TaxID=72917 RepID=UPI001CB9762D|nr:PH-interacting protein-like isoform X2 [Erigeron canadensis]
MESGHHTSFDKASSAATQHLGFIDRLSTKSHNQPESEPGHDVAADIDVDLREIYFLVMHFLSASPCEKTFTQFCNELMEYQLLPKRYHAWYSRYGTASEEETGDGVSFPLSYESVTQRYSHIEKDHLVKLLKQLILHVAPSRGIFGRTPPTAADVPTLLGIGPFSLLGSTQNETVPPVKALPAYLRWPHMQADQVHGIGLREIGGGFPKHHRAPSIRFACYAIAKPSTMVQKMQNIKKLRGHRDAVYCAIFDRSGRYVITGSDDRLVKIWSMETAFCLASCRGHEGDITDLAVNINNSVVASASNDYNIRVWHLPNGKPLSVLRGHTAAVTAIAFSPRHPFQLLSSSDDGTCRIWEARSSQCREHVYVPRQTQDVAGSNNGPSSGANPQSNQILCCAYNANGSIFVTGSSDTFARVWVACKPNTDASQQPIHEFDVLAGHENDVNYVQFSGCAVASRSSTSDTVTDEKVPKFKTSWFSHDYIVTCSRDGSAIIWIPKRKSHGRSGRWTRAYHLKVPPPPMPPQPRRGGPRQRFLPTPRGVNMIVWSLDDRFVLAAIMDCRICVWNASDGRLVHSLTGHSESTYVLDVHPFNPRIAMSSGYDGKTIIWDIWEGVPIRIYEIGRFKLVDGKFSPDGTSVVLSDDVGQIYLLNTGQGESQKDSMYDQFFLGDYRPLARDAHGNAIDQETQLQPYQRNMQDALCDSSMLPYPEPYQSNYQRRRLGALNMEWRPPSRNFAIGTDIGLGQEYQMLPLADLDVVAEPLPEFLDAMFWEPENDVIIDSTDSEYNVTDDDSSGDEQASLGKSSVDAAESSGGNNIDDRSRRWLKRKKLKDLEWESSSGRRVKTRNSDDHEGTSSRCKGSKKSKNNRNSKATPSRPQRTAARNGKKLSSQDFGSEKDDDDLSEDDSSESEPCVEEEDKPTVLIGVSSTVNAAPPPESRHKLVLKLPITKKSPVFETIPIQCHDPSTSLRHKEENSKHVSGDHETTANMEENGRTEDRKPTKIIFKSKTGLNSDAKSLGECSQTNNEADDTVSQKKNLIKLKLSNPKAKNNDNLTEVDSSEDAIPRIKPLRIKLGFRESDDAPQNHNNEAHMIPYDSSMNGASGSKINGQCSKTNWLLLADQDEGCRYIPQLGDEVAYLRQGHQEYSELQALTEHVPWIQFGEKIRDVEICSVDAVNYVQLVGSGESGCKIKLRFIDPSSKVKDKTFQLTLPELVNFPDFLVERTCYEASLERNWHPGDRCSVWWRDQGGGGQLWEGVVVSISDKSPDFPGSPWEKFSVTYSGDEVELTRHSPWELLDKDIRGEQPGIDPNIRKMMISLLSKLEQSTRGNQDKYGIMKLKRASEKPEFINRFPVPLTLDIIDQRVKKFYYRSFEALKHDITVMLSNGQAFFLNHANMSAKLQHLSEWFDRKLSTLR